MISPIDYIQLKAFARQDGLMIGCLWILTFACFIASMKYPDYQIGFFAGICSTPFFVFYRLRHFRDKVLDGNISYRRALTFTMFVIGYASVLIAGATFVYFYFIDNGAFVSTIQSNIETPEMTQYIKEMGLDNKALNEQMTLLKETRPIDFAFNMLWNGIISGFLLSLVLAAFGKRTRKITA